MAHGPATMARAFDLGQLNEAQRLAVKTLEGPVLILAGAGTGKTRTITARIGHMVGEGIEPEGILAVTFTNKAANEMRERVAAMVGKKTAAKMTLCTFHSLCVRILRSAIDRLGYKRNFSIYSQGDQQGLVKKIIVRRGGRDEKLDASVVLATISACKNRGLSLEDAKDALLAVVAKEYEAEKKALNAVDFDDLLVLAVELLREHGDVRDQWQQRFRYIMVDEFQDTNRLQMDLMRLLAGSHSNICVVGDDDQSIYGWRGAEISNILDFERFFPDPTIIKLEENYRSTQAILHTANSIIAHNLQRRDKRLWSGKHGAEKVRLVLMPGDLEEAETIVDEIMLASHMEKRPWEDFAVLFRMNSQSRLLEEKLRERNIPYRVVGGQSFFDRREVKDVLSYLVLLVHPDDDVNLLRILNTPPRGIGKTVAERAIEMSRSDGTSVFATLRSPAFLETLSSKARKAVEAFVQMIIDFGAQAGLPSSNYAEVGERMIRESGYENYIERMCKTPEEAMRRRESVHDLIGDVYRHHGRHSSKGLRGFLDDVVLGMDRDDDKEDIANQQGVCLITLHAAKGLEFPIVYLVGLEEGVLPHRRSVEEGSRDEERRLFYVGITRAMERLTITYCHVRKRFGEKVACLPSSFLQEMDRKEVEELNLQDINSQPLEDDDAEQSFAMLYEMLGEIEGDTQSGA